MVQGDYERLKQYFLTFFGYNPEDNSISVLKEFQVLKYSPSTGMRRYCMLVDFAVQQLYGDVSVAATQANPPQAMVTLYNKLRIDKFVSGMHDFPQIISKLGRDDLFGENNWDDLVKKAIKLEPVYGSTSNGAGSSSVSAVSSSGLSHYPGTGPKSQWGRQSSRNFSSDQFSSRVSFTVSQCKYLGCAMFLL